MKVIILKLEHQKLNPKLNASHFENNYIVSTITLNSKRPNKESLFSAFILPKWLA
jgi:hypothetical protein